MQRCDWLRARGEAEQVIYLCVRFPRDCHRLIKWIRDYSLFTNRFDILFFPRTDTSSTSKVARTWHFSRCNFYASEFCAWMFNSGFRTLLFTMTIDLIKLWPRRAFRAARKHAFVYSCYASLRNWVFFGIRVSLTELRVILKFIFPKCWPGCKTDRRAMREGHALFM